MSLQDDYARLKDGESIELPADDLLAIERAGFVGLTLAGGRVRAWKGKDGPCFETGRSATYKGAAVAALDDDRHLLFGTMRLCEKTARVYRLPAYAGLVDVTEPTAPGTAPFDCDTFEKDAADLASEIRSPAEAAPTSPAKAGHPVEPVSSISADRVAMLYPGPFKLLILKNGDIVRRGQAVKVRRADAEALKREGVSEVAEGVEPLNYLEEHRARGALCLLGEWPLRTSMVPREPNLKALADASPSMRRRLLKLIERGDEYFLLVGSDPSDKGGCCPSDDVGHANALVRAGILEGWTASAEASCPSTVYAFAGEIASRGERPAFTRQAALRDRVRDGIASGAGLPAKLAVRLALLALGLAGLGLAVWALLRDLRS